MAATTAYRAPRKFGVEHLETRLTLSASPVVNHDILTSAASTSLVSELGTTQQRISMAVGSSSTPAVGDTTVSGVTSVDMKGYSSINNAKVVYEGGRYIVGYVQPTGSYVEYKVYVSNAGSYNIATEFAAPTGQASVNFKVNGNSAGTYTAAKTSSWAAYASQNKSVALNAGWNTLRYESTGVGYNIGSIVITPPSTTQTVNGSSTAIDLSKYSNITGSVVTGSNGNYALEYVQNNSYIEFSINVQSSGTYTLSSDFASPWSSSTADVKIDGSTKGSYTFSGTGGWQSYSNKTLSLNLSAGVHTLRIQSNNSGYNLKNVVLKNASGTTTDTSTGSVTVATQNMTSFNQLNITGTSGADNITLTQSGDTLTLKANGYTTTYSASAYGNIVIKGGDGNDTITIDSSVKVITLIYGNNGNDTLTNKAVTGTIVAIGNGTDYVVGNGSNTSIWVDSGDSASGSNNIHKVSSFYGGVSLDLNGQNLKDPSGSNGTVTRLTKSSLWGTGPTVSDVNQGQLGDCYLLATMESMANNKASALKELAVDLGDGTYAIQFKRNGVTTYVRVDGDLPAGGYYINGVAYAHPGASGNQWMAIMEKAYAVFRTGSYSYSSISTGWMSSVFSDFGYSPTSVSTSSQSTFYTTISNALNSGKAVTYGTKSSVSGAPLIANHAYSIVGVSLSSSGVLSVTLRNPWGFDGAGNDGNTSDGKVTVTFAQLANNSLGVVLA